MMAKRLLQYLQPLLIAMLLTATAQADKADDSEALKGVEVGKIAWDITQGNPAVLAARLEVIEQTYEDMLRQNVRPEMLFAFRGGAILLLQRDHDALPFEQRADVEVVQRKLGALLARPGVRMEACQIAMRRVGLASDDLLPGIHTVGNTFLSLMGFGQRGYIAIPIN